MLKKMIKKVAKSFRTKLYSNFIINTILLGFSFDWKEIMDDFETFCLRLLTILKEYTLPAAVVAGAVYYVIEVFISKTDQRELTKRKAAQVIIALILIGIMLKAIA